MKKRLVDFVRETIDMMVSSAYASCMRTVLHFYIQAAEKLGREQGLPEKRAQLAAWKELMDAFGQSGDDNAENELLPDVWQEIELLDEMLCRNRLYKGYSQEKLSEGICSPETLSRIENARQSPTSEPLRHWRESFPCRRSSIIMKFSRIIWIHWVSTGGLCCFP